MTFFHELSDWNGVQQWFFKTKMSFFGMDLALPWWFGVSSWHYAIYGIIMLLVEPPWVKKSRFPYRATAFALIFLQDYVFMTDDSILHVMDRAIATPAAAMEACRIISYVTNNVSWLIIAATIVVELAAVYCFVQSAKAQADMHRDNFVFWHFCWHCYPLVASLLVASEFYQRQFEIRRLEPKSVEYKLE